MATIKTEVNSNAVRFSRGTKEKLLELKRDHPELNIQKVDTYLDDTGRVYMAIVKEKIDKPRKKSWQNVIDVVNVEELLEQINSDAWNYFE